MTTIKIADIVAGLPYGNEGKKRWRTVGALLKNDKNDPTKGPGFTVVLDTIFNPAGLPNKDGQVLLSCFNPKEPYQGPPERPIRQPQLPDFNGDDRDIPF